jgi:hypothetical protein
MLRKLCGEVALKNVVFVTNMWGGVNHRVAVGREAKLKGDDTFFRPMLNNGARRARHENTTSSAEMIIRLLLHNHSIPLRIQEELVDESKDLCQTGAGEELDRELVAALTTSLGPPQITIASVLHCILLGHVCYLCAPHI